MTARIVTVPALPTSKKRDKHATTLDGMVVDLFKRVESPLNFNALSADEHVDGIRSIQRILNQVQRHERQHMKSAKQQPALSGEQRMECLREWLDQEAVETEGLIFSASLPQGAGVVAGRKFEKDELVATLPIERMMTVASAIRTDPAVGLLFATDKWFRAVPSLILAMHLLFQKHAPNGSSKWAGYIRSLPGQQFAGEVNSDDDIDTPLLPLAFSLSTVEAMREMTALVEYHRMIRTVAKQYCHMRAVLHQLRSVSPLMMAAADDWFTFREFRWAVSMVMMRQNEVPIITRIPKSEQAEGERSSSGEQQKKEEASEVPPAAAGAGAGAAAAGADLNGRTGSGSARSSSEGQVEGKGGSEEEEEGQVVVERALALIPVLDMFNHEEGPISSEFNLHLQQMEVTAKRTFEEGEQIFMSYGYRPNTMLLLYAGFLPASNQRDRIRVVAELAPSDPLYSKKVSLLKWNDLPPSALFDIFWDGTPSEEFATWLRVASETREGEITAEIRAAITKKTAAAASKAAATSEAEKTKPGSQPSSSLNLIPDIQLSPAQASLLRSICDQRISRMRSVSIQMPPTPSSSAASEQPAGLGLALDSKKKTKQASSAVCHRELDLVRRLRELELAALENALAKCDSILGKK